MRITTADREAVCRNWFIPGHDEVGIVFRLGTGFKELDAGNLWQFPGCKGELTGMVERQSIEAVASTSKMLAAGPCSGPDCPDF